MGRKVDWSDFDSQCGKVWTDAGSKCGTHFCMEKGNHKKHICSACKTPKR